MLSNVDLESKKVGFIGGGNMARAIGATLIKKGILNPYNVFISARTETTLAFWKQLGTNTTLDNSDVVRSCEIVFFAVKPQFLDDALRTAFQEYVISPEKIYISVIVGLTVNRFQEKIRQITDYNMHKIFRTMPNTPLSVSAGITVYCCLESVSENDESIVKELFSNIGMVEKVDEVHINTIGALAGSGPAFAYLTIEALADGAVKKGLPRALATKFAAQVLVGAGKMVLETGKHPGQLKDEVCSAGGTTITGVHALELGGVRGSFMNAIEAAVNRSNELAS